MTRIEHQLTIIGGGMAGITAAITAARKGVKVALINDRPVLGGNHSSELRVHYNGAAHSVAYYAREAGISDEIKMTIFKYNPRYNTKDDYELTDMALFNMVYEEANITLYLNTFVYDVSMANAKIKSVYGRQMGSEKEFEFVSPLFVDGSGDGLVAYKAGALYTIGREAKSDYKESLGVDVADDKTMGSCVLFKVGKADKVIPFTKPPFAYDYEKDAILKWAIRPNLLRNLPKNEAISEVDGLWWLSYGGDIDTIGDNEAIRDELNRLVYGFWDYAKNSGIYPEADYLYLKWVAPIPGKRESRRFYGDYVLSQNDIIQRPDFEDAVSTGGWSLDIHDVEGVYGSGRASAFGHVSGLYNIPYRIMYSKNIANLFLVGRITSVTHVALGSTRVMQTLATMAQAVGTAASVCLQKDLMPRDIYEKGYYKEVQNQLQRDGQYIVGMIEDVGLLKNTTVSASSFRQVENTEVTERVKLDKNYGFTIPVESERVDSVEVRLCNTSLKRQKLRVLVLAGSYSGNYSPDQIVNEIEVGIDGEFDGWLTLPLDSGHNDGQKLYVVCCVNEAIDILINHQRVIGAPSFSYNEHKMTLENYRVQLPLNDVQENSLGFRNIIPKQNVYRPESVLNGIARPFGLPNAWVSEEAEAWLQFDFEKAQKIEEIQISFNPQMETNNFSSPIRQMVKDYLIEVTKTDGTLVKIEVEGNYQGLNRHYLAIDGVKCIRFVFTATYGSPYYEVLSVKAF